MDEAFGAAGHAGSRRRFARIDHCAREGAVSRRRYGIIRSLAGSAALPVQGLRQDLQRVERYAAVGLAPQGTLAGSGRRWRRGRRLKASAARCDVAVSTAFRCALTGFWRRRGAIRRYSRGSWKRTRPTSWRAGRARAGWDARHGGGAASLSEEARPLARAGAGSHGGGPERDDGQRGAAPGRCGERSRLHLDPVVAKDALLVSDGGASYPPRLRRRARGEPNRSTQPLDGGTGSGRSACADGEQPPQ